MSRHLITPGLATARCCRSVLQGLPEEEVEVVEVSTPVPHVPVTEGRLLVHIPRATDRDLHQDDPLLVPLPTGLLDVPRLRHKEGHHLRLQGILLHLVSITGLLSDITAAENISITRGQDITAVITVSIVIEVSMTGDMMTEDVKKTEAVMMTG